MRLHLSLISTFFRHTITVTLALGATYRIAGYFRGVLIFVIFVANPGVTKFSTHKIFTRTLLQVCEHQPSSCFVDVVASHARLDTEALHLSIQTLTGKSLALRSSSKRKFASRAPPEFKVRITLCAKEYNNARHEI